MSGYEVLDTYGPIAGGPSGGSSKRLQDWIERWRDEPGVKVLVAKDYSHLIVVRWWSL